MHYMGVCFSYCIKFKVELQKAACVWQADSVPKFAGLSLKTNYKLFTEYYTSFTKCKYIQINARKALMNECCCFGYARLARK